jgi:tetrapyrrole methylase family protein/MazG family protein
LPTLHVVGLGPGSAALLTEQARQVLSSAGEVLLRTMHPAAEVIPVSVPVRTFDPLYESADSFDDVYDQIVAEVIRTCLAGPGCVYAVPGDPAMGEATVTELMRRAPSVGLTVHLVHGISFVEPCLAALGVDGLDGLFVGDALEVARLHHPPFPPDRHALLGQLHSRLVASDVKLTLINAYPEAHEVALVHAAGTAQVQVQRMPLHAIDQSRAIGPLTALFVPALPTGHSLEAFQDTVAQLRAPDGCPWDREQTHASLRPHLLEEAYEALHAIDSGDPAALQEELGDLLLQIVLQAQIAVEEGEFSLGEVVHGIETKILRRHPHVFGDVSVGEVDEVLRNWEALKATERQDAGEGKGSLDGVPLGLPALAQAAEIQDRVARIGFDWPQADGARDKILEELDEIARAGSERIVDEVGDLLFSVVNYSRRLGVDAESALRTAAVRFRRRFARVEALAGAAGSEASSLSLEELDALWEQAKSEGL